MDLRQLRYFLGIVEHGSVSRAAEVLHVAQPALSLHLKRLEMEFGCELVHRTARGVVATESGRRLALRAQTLIDGMNTLKDEVRGAEAVPTGPTIVGIPTSLGTILTVPLVKAVRDRFPGIRLRVIEGLSGHMQEWLLTGTVDLAVIFGSQPSYGIDAEFVAREKLCLVTRADNPAFRCCETIEMDRVLELPLILPGRPHGVREEVERAAAERRLAPKVVVEVDALEQIKALVAEGVGHSILSRRYAQFGATTYSLQAIPIVSPIIERTISIASVHDRPMSIATKAIHPLLGELFRLHVSDRE